MPDNKVALALIKTARCPVAAPSANLAGKPSPTTAAHVAEDLGASVDLILDGGKTCHGLESTVIAVTGKKVEILRTGAVTAEMLAKILGYQPKIVHHAPDKNGKVKSPGMKYRHYAPSVDLVLVAEPDRKKMIAVVERLIGEYHRRGLMVGVLSCKEHRKFYQTADETVVCGSLKNPATVAKNLYASLRKFRPAMADIVIAENFGSTGIGRAIFDRLSRAATIILS
jgi:L-threonylcarbamoyladenylate synthase